jgi:hypothetical protein
MYYIDSGANSMDYNYTSYCLMVAVRIGGTVIGYQRGEQDHHLQQFVAPGRPAA